MIDDTEKALAQDLGCVVADILKDVAAQVDDHTAKLLSEAQEKLDLLRTLYLDKL